jgi:hypothetical protein
MAMDNYDYLIELYKDTTTNLYNMFISTYNGDSFDLNVFICDRRHEMRMDLVSKDIYGTNKYVGTLCNLNNIMLPFSIVQGDVLIYPPSGQVQDLTKVNDVLKNPTVTNYVNVIKNELINSLKARKKDPNKGNYNSNRPSVDVLPPTVPESSVPDIVLENNIIKISPSLYVNPNNNINIVPTAPSLSPKISTTTSNNDTTSNNGTTERVLVNRYIIQNS